MSTSSFPDRLAEIAAEVERRLDAALADTVLPGETVRPPRLMAAMRHAVLGGGKRLRPFLAVEAARLVAGTVPEAAWRAGLALEFVHCYSLVHDDLPAMDDDDLRRGRPTVHRAYDEATAILAGDGLLTYAFDHLADPATTADAAVRAELVLLIARAAGLGGMVGGQLLDLGAEGRFTEAGTPLALPEAAIRELQSMKTGALIRAACEMGAVAAGADAATRARLRRYGEIVGLAFQLADDLLDVESTAEAMGKAVGKDAAMGKGTLVSLHGVDWTKAALAGLVAEAQALLSVDGAGADVLVETARFIAERRS